MEYKKDKRTENLTLRDIHVGDWVQVWSETAERYSPPLKIIQICDDGTIYLVTNDEERATPWEENIKDVDVLPITPELLKGFGFEVEAKYQDQPLEEIIEGLPPFMKEMARGWGLNLIYYNNIFIGYIKECPEVDAHVFCRPIDNIYCIYAHKLFAQLIEKKVLENVQWKGLEQ